MRLIDDNSLHSQTISAKVRNDMRYVKVIVKVMDYTNIIQSIGTPIAVS